MSLLAVPIAVTNGEFANYTHLLVDETSQEGFLVDPAWERSRIEAEMGRREVRLRGILLTHSHDDHTDLAAAFARDYGVAVWISRTEAKFYGFWTPNLRLLQDRDQIQAGASVITVLETPGHTAGGVCYFTGDDLFTGDTLFVEGCGICTCHGADPRAMFRSLRMLKEIVPPGCRVFPGHSYGASPGMTFGELARQNIYLAFDNEESFVRYRMRPGRSFRAQAAGGPTGSGG